MALVLLARFCERSFHLAVEPELVRCQRTRVLLCKHLRDLHGGTFELAAPHDASHEPARECFSNRHSPPGLHQIDSECEPADLLRNRRTGERRHAEIDLGERDRSTIHRNARIRQKSDHRTAAARGAIQYRDNGFGYLHDRLEQRTESCRTSFTMRGYITVIRFLPHV